MSSILQLKNITKSFNNQKAVDDVEIKVKEGEIVALAGESGCGKTTLAKVAIGLERPDSGEMLLKGEAINLFKKRPKVIKKKIQLVFQNALGSFNPKFSLRDSISQPLIEHKITKSKSATEEKLKELFDLVSLDINLLDRLPHQVSGGQIQRAAIARAIACEPDLLIADEPTSALDVSIRAQVLKLFKDLRQKKNLSCLIISHDLPSLKFLTDKIYVMNKGQIVEHGLTNDVLNNPKESYTKRLIAAIPSIKPEDKTFEQFKQFALT